MIEADSLREILDKAIRKKQIAEDKEYEQNSRRKRNKEHGIFS